MISSVRILDLFFGEPRLVKEYTDDQRTFTLIKNLISFIRIEWKRITKKASLALTILLADTYLHFISFHIILFCVHVLYMCFFFLYSFPFSSCYPIKMKFTS